jgi:hypothetical protein
MFAFILGAPCLLYTLPTVGSVNGDTFKCANLTNGVHKWEGID